MPSRNRLLLVLFSILTACQVDTDPVSSSESTGETTEGVGVEDVKTVRQALTFSNVIDTTLHSGAASANYGADATLNVSAVSVADIQRTLIRFDLSDLVVPAGQAVYAARIDLSTTGISAGWLGDSMDIFRIVTAHAC